MRRVCLNRHILFFLYYAQHEHYLTGASPERTLIVGIVLPMARGGHREVESARNKRQNTWSDKQELHARHNSRTLYSDPIFSGNVWVKSCNGKVVQCCTSSILNKLAKDKNMAPNTLNLNVKAKR